MTMPCKGRVAGGWPIVTKSLLHKIRHAMDSKYCGDQHDCRTCAEGKHEQQEAMRTKIRHGKPGG